MNSRERVMIALNHQEPDRVPVDMKLTIDVYKDVRQYLGLLDLPENLKMGQWTEVEMPVEMIQALDLDIYYTAARRVQSVHSQNYDDGSFTDEWGVYWKKTMVDNGHFYFEVQNPPLADANIEDLDKYEWPDPEDSSRFAGMREELEKIRNETNLAILVKTGGAVFEVATFMRGHERWYRDLVSNQPFAHALMAKIASIQKKINKRGIEEIGEYIDIFRIGGEDLGMQDRPLVSPRTFRNVLKPHFENVWLSAKEDLLKKNPNAKVMLHSCGCVSPFISQLIECGVDVLDPIQPLAKGMNRYELKQDYGDYISFHGNLDIQKILPFGTKDEICAEVKDSLKALAPGGGFIIGPAHNVQGDVCAENLVYAIECAHKYGKYPLELD